MRWNQASVGGGGVSINLSKTIFSTRQTSATCWKAQKTHLGRIMSPPKILGLTRILRWALDLDVSSKLVSSSLTSPLRTAATTLSCLFFLDFLEPLRLCVIYGSGVESLALLFCWQHQHKDKMIEWWVLQTSAQTNLAQTKLRLRKSSTTSHKTHLCVTALWLSP